MVETYGIQFKSLRSLLRCLGYGGVMSQKSVLQNYGGIDQLVKKRLGLDDPVEIKRALILCKKKETKAFNIDDLEDNATNAVHIDALCFDVLKALYKQYDQDKKDLIINTIASVNNIDAVELASKLDQLLQ